MVYRIQGLTILEHLLLLAQQGNRPFTQASQASQASSGYAYPTSVSSLRALSSRET